MKGEIEARGEAVGAAAAKRSAAILAERIAEAVPGARVRVWDDGVEIEGRGLRFHPALRWIGSLGR